MTKDNKQTAEMLRRTRRKIKIAWIAISLLAVLGMIGFTIIPLFQTL